MELNEKKIEFVAREICIALGLDPDEKAYGNLDNTRFTNYSSDETFVPDVAYLIYRWETYKTQAAIAIASDIAIKRFQDEN